ncbi:hypothetical protein WR25_21997 isoform I [Diploscapter pachys]|uniref:SP-RING-type domain-containing protein n=2 Tax=Diploscapter pachys TaxID=2018661 RepID=A0A2A2L9I4_9BILA|nr:hypothetical protein WR25_21997 isoform A [Diploscapter pachys]PAV82830.1 hypothetical protein WR25_21997 isoform F [Diploscapter pachys]PAV82831.1 hypothetical protein WR25_21997 isoform G [Diploscapter pachys]PAV82833.1 hypothetical protein WR25_21997 isoform I [Diploscapter pachys]
MSHQQLSNDELRYYENSISQLRVNEIQTILGYFRSNKLGKKNELINRCITLLRNPTYQAQMAHHIRDMSKRNQRINSSGYPHPVQNNGYQGSYATPLYAGHSHSHSTPHPVSNGYRGTFNAYSGGSTMSSVQTVQMQSRPVNFPGFRPILLPFYDFRHVVLAPMELPAILTGLKQQAKLYFNFQVPTQHVQNLRYQSDKKELPRDELQLRFFHLNPEGQLPLEFPDEFPLQCVVRIDDTNVTLPNIIPTNKPNVEAKRPSRPVNITPYCQPPRDQGNHRMVIEWTADKRVWAVLINVVHRVNADILKAKAINNPAFHRSYEETKSVIIRRLSGDDEDGIQMDQLKISLLCPKTRQKVMSRDMEKLENEGKEAEYAGDYLSKTRMRIPARGRDCTHLQCFDLEAYLMMNEKKPTWKCAVCSSNTPYSKLIIDKYFERMVNSVDPSFSEVELLKDGNYQTIKEDVFELSDSDDDEVKPAKIAARGGGQSNSVAEAPKPSTSTAHSTAPTSVKSKAPIEEITLSDDEDDATDIDLSRAVQESIRIAALAQQGGPDSNNPSTAPGSNSTAGNGFCGISSPSMVSMDASTPSSVPSSATLIHRSPPRPSKAGNKIIDCITIDDDDSPEKEECTNSSRKRAATSALEDDMEINTTASSSNSQNHNYKQTQQDTQSNNHNGQQQPFRFQQSHNTSGPPPPKTMNLKTALDELLSNNSPFDQNMQSTSLDDIQLQPLPSSAPFDNRNHEHPSVRTSTPSSAPVHSGTGTAFPMPNNFMQAAMQQHQNQVGASNPSSPPAYMPPAPVSRTMSAGIQCQNIMNQSFYQHPSPQNWPNTYQMFTPFGLPPTMIPQQPHSSPNLPSTSAPSPHPSQTQFIGSRPPLLGSPQAFSPLFFPGQHQAVSNS